MSSREFCGGCLCERLRYAARALPIDVGYCHCRVCQRSSGAPVLAWASFPTDSFGYTQGSPASYRSSPRATREFCANCGTQIVFREDGHSRVHLNVASLDRPDALSPQYHIWTESRIPWFDTVDSLPRYPDAGPDDLEG
jgi:hypothetical protein